ncbi:MULTISPECIES: DUF6243 family protein [unclassified Streptomyces]|uniref:DUF6243 family protein n=1 Tax=unclassified Streptomyces TaxID=2593676 RepID=UPI0033A7A1D4
MAKSRNNLLGVGGQRKKLSRADQHGAGQGRAAARRTADEQKQELLKKMRERAQGAENGTEGTGSADTTGAVTAQE